MAGSDFWVSQRWFAGLTYSNVTFLAGVAALVRQQGTVCALKIKVHKPSFSSLSISNHSFYFFVFSGTKIIIMDYLYQTKKIWYALKQDLLNKQT